MAFISNVLLDVCGSRKDRHKRGERESNRKREPEKAVGGWLRRCSRYEPTPLIDSWGKNAEKFALFCWTVCVFVTANSARGSCVKQVVIVSLFTQTPCVFDNCFHCGLSNSTEITLSAIAV